MKKKKKMVCKNEKSTLMFDRIVVVCLLSLFSFMFLVNFVFADPSGASSIAYDANETYSGSETGAVVNISGGYIATFNVSATSQNRHWKAFVGQVIGEFALQDSSGSTIYDWTLSSTSGMIYASRASTGISWTSINCSNVTTMEAENVEMALSNSDDNITATFDDTTHNSFWVGTSVNIAANQCPTTNTYVDNATSTEFEEMVLYDDTNIVYGSIIEETDVGGFDGQNYDFQMIVPENGTVGYTGATAYYIYVEVT